MAYQIRERKDELEEQCRKLGIVENVNNYTTDKRVYKDDFIRALRDYYLEHQYNNNPPKSLELLDENLVSPMLACRYKKLKDDEKKEIWDSDDWYLEEKCDGVRMLMTYVSEGEGFNFYSRNLSVEDYLPIQYKNKIWLDNIDKSKIKDKFIVDSELISLSSNIDTIVDKSSSGGVVTETQLDAITALLGMEPEKTIPIQKRDSVKLQFVIFDCIYWNGEWLFDKPLKERREYMFKAFEQLNQAGFTCRLPEKAEEKKKQFYKNIINEGKEGVIAKNLNYKYIPNSYRRRQGWVKIKRSVTETMEIEGIGDTIDAWVSGYKIGNEGTKWENYVGALKFNIYMENRMDSLFGDGETEPEEHEIAVVSSISDKLRKEITEWDENGNPKLKKEVYGRVAELDGQSITGRNLRLKHARIVRWRPDKQVGQCVVDKEFLESMIL